MPSINEKKLAALSPTAFENLVFDLVRADSMQNVHWRTPGADGGRDIEGEMPLQDFAGHTRRSRWLIECKRYKSTVDWPTVWPKVAYADNEQADFLLMVTTGKFSTRCLDEIEKWNNKNRRPAIRVWAVHEIAFRLFLKPSIAAKYDLLEGAVTSAVNLSNLALHVSRMTQAAIAHTDPVKIGRYTFAASSLANLLYVRSIDLVQVGSFRSAGALANDDVPAFVTGVSKLDFAGFDWIGLSAFLACICVIAKAPLKASKRADAEILISAEGGLLIGVQNLALMQEVAFWGGLIVSQEGSSLCLTPQIFA